MIIKATYINTSSDRIKQQRDRHQNKNNPPQKLQAICKTIERIWYQLSPTLSANRD